MPAPFFLPGTAAPTSAQSLPPLIADQLVKPAAEPRGVLGDMIVSGKRRFRGIDANIASFYASTGALDDQVAADRERAIRAQDAYDPIGDHGLVGDALVSAAGIVPDLVGAAAVSTLAAPFGAAVPAQLAYWHAINAGSQYSESVAQGNATYEAAAIANTIAIPQSMLDYVGYKILAAPIAKVLGKDGAATALATVVEGTKRNATGAIAQPWTNFMKGAVKYAGRSTLTYAEETSTEIPQNLLGVFGDNAANHIANELYNLGLSEEEAGEYAQNVRETLKQSLGFAPLALISNGVGMARRKLAAERKVPNTAAPAAKPGDAGFNHLTLANYIGEGNGAFELTVRSEGKEKPLSGSRFEIRETPEGNDQLVVKATAGATERIIDPSEIVAIHSKDPVLGKQAVWEATAPDAPSLLLRTKATKAFNDEIYGYIPEEGDITDADKVDALLKQADEVSDEGYIPGVADISPTDTVDIIEKVANTVSDEGYIPGVASITELDEQSIMDKVANDVSTEGYVPGVADLYEGDTPAIVEKVANGVQEDALSAFRGPSGKVSFMPAREYVKQQLGLASFKEAKNWWDKQADPEQALLALKQAERKVEPTKVGQMMSNVAANKGPQAPTVVGNLMAQAVRGVVEAARAIPASPVTLNGQQVAPPTAPVDAAVGQVEAAATKPVTSEVTQNPLSSTQTRRDNIADILKAVNLKANALHRGIVRQLRDGQITPEEAAAKILQANGRADYTVTDALQNDGTIARNVALTVLGTESQRPSAETEIAVYEGFASLARRIRYGYASVMGEVAEMNMAMSPEDLRVVSKRVLDGRRKVAMGGWLGEFHGALSAAVASEGAENVTPEMVNAAAELLHLRAEAYASQHEGVSPEAWYRARFASTPVVGASVAGMEAAAELGTLDQRTRVQQDTAYLDAVNRGDMETAQRMVDEAARGAGFSTLPLWHGTPNSFTTFDPSRSWFKGNELFFTDKKGYAKGYKGKAEGGNLLRVYLPSNILEVRTNKQHAEFMRNKLPGENAVDYALRLGFDGIHNSNSEFIVTDPTKVKSADPVTRDDSGAVIPLSARFNPQSPDIREQRTRDVLKGQTILDQTKRLLQISLTEHADATTLVHELAHVFRHDLMGAELETVVKHIRDNGIAVDKDARTGEYVWSVEAEEAWAETVDKVFKDGKVPTRPGLKALFEKFRGWFKAVYSQFVAKSDKYTVSEEVERVVHGMFYPALQGNSTAKFVTTKLESTRRRIGGINPRQWVFYSTTDAQMFMSLFGDANSGESMTDKVRMERAAKLLEEKGYEGVADMFQRIEEEGNIPGTVLSTAWGEYIAYVGNAKGREIVAAERRGDHETASRIRSEMADVVQSDLRVGTRLGQNLRVRGMRAKGMIMANAISSFEQLRLQMSLREFNELCQTMEKASNGDAEAADLLATKVDNALAPLQFSDYVSQIMFSGLLSDPATLARNAILNTVWSTWLNVPHRALTAAVDAGVSMLTGRQRETFLAELKASSTGYLKITQYLQEAKPILWTGESPVGAQDLDKVAMEITNKSYMALEHTPDIVNVPGLGKRDIGGVIRAAAPYLTFGTRVLRYCDYLANRVAEEGQTNALKLREKLRSEANPAYKPMSAEQIDREARKYARRSTFTDAPGGFLNGLNTLKKDLGPVAIPFMPFVRTIAQVGMRGLEMMPVVGLAVEYKNSKNAAKYEAKYAKGETGEGIYTSSPAEVIAKQIEGTLMLAALAYWFGQDDEDGLPRIAGAAPTSAKERQQWSAAGIVPYSVRVGGYWVGFDRLDPFANVLGATADVLSVYRATQQLDVEKATEARANAIYDILSRVGWFTVENSFASGMVRNLEGGRDQLGERATQQVFRTLIPYNGLLRGLGRNYTAIFDGGGMLGGQPTPDDTTVINALVRTAPFTRDIVDANMKKTPLGKPTEQAGNNLLFDWIPIKLAPMTTDPVELALLTVGYYPSLPSKALVVHEGKGKVDVPDDLYTKHCEASALAIKGALEKVVASPNFKRLDMSTADGQEKRHDMMEKAATSSTRLLDAKLKAEMRKRMRMGTLPQPL